MTDRELMQMALDALEPATRPIEEEAIQALRDRLAQPDIEVKASVHIEEELRRLHEENKALRDRLAQPEPEPVIGTKTWFEDGKLVTQNLHTSDIYKDPQPKQEQEPVLWVENLTDPQPHAVTDLKYCSVADRDSGKDQTYIPLYAAPPNTGAAVKAERKACVKVCDEQAEYWKNTSILEFAYQVAADEREACAEICDGISEWYETRTDLNQTQKQVGQLAAEVCGVRIRERRKENERNKLD